MDNCAIIIPNVKIIVWNAKAKKIIRHAPVLGKCVY